MNIMPSSKKDKNIKKDMQNPSPSRLFISSSTRDLVKLGDQENAI